MNSFEQDFKEQLQTELKEQPQSVFTKNERARVLHNIRKEKRKVHILPKILTAIVAVISLFLIASVFSEDEQPSTSSTAEIEKESEPSQWLMDYNVGININGWTMVSKTEEESQEIVFSGHEVITGHSYKENNQWFLEVENYQYNLPLEPRRDNGIILTFPQMTDSVSEINSYTNALNTITAAEIVVTYEAGAPVYTVTEFDYGNTLEVSIYEKNNLSEYLRSIYAMLKSGEIDQDKMKKLTPMDVFHLFAYADVQKDYEVQYALFNQDNDKIGSMSYEEYEQARIEYQHSESFQAFENKLIKQVLIDENSALITNVEREGEFLLFKLNKSAEGIWKTNWLPMQ